MLQKKKQKNGRNGENKKMYSSINYLKIRSIYFSRSRSVLVFIIGIFIQTCSENAPLFARFNFAARFSILLFQDTRHCVASWKRISYAAPLRIVLAHGASVEGKRKGEKEGIGHRDTLMSFSRDVPGAETIDKRRELEVRESHEVGSFGNKEGKKRKVGIKEKERRTEGGEGEREKEREKRRPNRGKPAGGGGGGGA